MPYVLSRLLTTGAGPVDAVEPDALLRRVELHQRVNVVSTPFGVGLKVFAFPDLQDASKNLEIHAFDDIEGVIQGVVAFCSYH